MAQARVAKTINNIDNTSNLMYLINRIGGILV
jgi:hypothetical protein